MPCIKYEDIPLLKRRIKMIDQANEIIEEYRAKGYDLTLRQLYYQFVARGLIENKQTEYKRLGSAVNDGRLMGLIDWDSIVDRTRNVRRLPTWDGPEEIIQSAALGFRTDLWETQDHRVEVWVEKDALTGVFEDVCNELRIPLFACRGYVSQSEQWAAGRRFHRIASSEGKTPVILHFGDHDPSGIDMTRDIERRIRLFMSDPEDGDDQSDRLIIDRLALNMAQVRQYNPPPNPAKITDIRIHGYRKQFKTDSSWELDALSPEVLVALVRGAVARYRDDKRWAAAVREEERQREDLTACHGRWDEVVSYLNNGEDRE